MTTEALSRAKEKPRKKRNAQTKQFEWAQRTKNIKIASRSCKKSHMVVRRLYPRVGHACYFSRKITFTNEFHRHQGGNRASQSRLLPRPPPMSISHCPVYYYYVQHTLLKIHWHYYNKIRDQTFWHVSPLNEQYWSRSNKKKREKKKRNERKKRKKEKKKRNEG